MKKSIFFILIFLSLFISCQRGKSDSFALLEKKQKDKVWVVAHRANTGEGQYPENSIETMESCIANDVDIIEIDVRETIDGHFVIMHDKTVDRTTNGTGNVSDMTLEEIKQLLLVHNNDTTTYRVPTLEEVFKIIKGKILVDLDIKFEDSDSYKKLIDLASAYDVQDQLLLFLYDKEDVESIHEMAVDLQILPRARSLSDIEYLKKYGFINIIHIDESYYDDMAMKKLIEGGLRLWINTLGEFDELEKSEKNGFESFFYKMPHVNVVQTDLAIDLMNYLKSKKMRN
ncbi:glycerophosphodiester phosphodiesterase family protein [Sphingobacterium sp. UT-1RO-CII-1]|uniref:glycerophosphodiester phosphodiesterase family protein n=1 Tax=Sphingobacterium sp. UT-1RO-CII-1 TaxID=2995225 RepID=UPI00227AF32C|nr:glycerophosphodiester phosphodiesterase family protein [Sphingobacterium sp. UT-1RO-CII-1]MCY4779416.1 glycerophosphodiester phosphodiesterase family protein [Sphingobacterium sp. UT-1RO-CII-1]